MIKHNSLDIKNILVGNTNVLKIYYNKSIVWPKEDPVPVSMFYFEAEEEGATVKMEKHENAPDVALEYSTDVKNWSDFIVSSTTIMLQNVGDKCYLRAKTENSGFGSGYTSYNYFVLSKKIVAKGNIQYLLKSDGSRTDVSELCYFRLFYNCTSLTQAPALPAITLADSCYSYMFNGCTSLTQAPALPATTLADRCYNEMFKNCTSLTQAPQLPAKSFSEFCYYLMFYSCTKLKISEDTEGGTVVLNIPTGSTRMTNWNVDMFTGTNGSFKDTPQVGHTYRCY